MVLETRTATETRQSAVKTPEEEKLDAAHKKALQVDGLVSFDKILPPRAEESKNLSSVLVDWLK